MESKPGYEQTIVNLYDLIQHSRDAGYTFDRIGLSGGEPLMWPKLRKGLTLLRESGICKFLQVQTNGDCIAASDAPYFDECFNYLDRVRVSLYGKSARRDLVKLLPLNGHKLDFVDRTTHWELPTRRYPGTLPADCMCGHFTLIGDKVWVCGSPPTMIPQFGWCEADYTQYWRRLGPGFLDDLRKVNKFNQPHCEYCAVNKKIIPQLAKVRE
jgi:hypothetical protein